MYKNFLQVLEVIHSPVLKIFLARCVRLRETTFLPEKFCNFPFRAYPASVNRPWVEVPSLLFTDDIWITGCKNMFWIYNLNKKLLWISVVLLTCASQCLRPFTERRRSGWKLLDLVYRMSVELSVACLRSNLMAVYEGRLDFLYYFDVFLTVYHSIDLFQLPT